MLSFEAVTPIATTLIELKSSIRVLFVKTNRRTMGLNLIINFAPRVLVQAAAALSERLVRQTLIAGQQQGIAAAAHRLLEASTALRRRTGAVEVASHIL